jgi:hypothetical protein
MAVGAELDECHTRIYVLETENRRLQEETARQQLQITGLAKDNVALRMQLTRANLVVETLKDRTFEGERE